MANMAKVATLVDEAASARESARLRELAPHESKEVRVAVAANPLADNETIQLLLGDGDESVRLAAAGNLADRPKLQLAVVDSEDKWMRAVLAHTFLRQDHLSLPYEVQAALAHDAFDETRQRIAETTDFADLFEMLLEDATPGVRGWCAANPRISRAQMGALVSDRAWKVRALAATLGLKFPDDEQLLRLARDRSAEVRWAVLSRVDRPREAIEILADDSDERNRRHAQLALVDVHNIMSADVEAAARTDRKRVAAVSSFEDPLGAR